MERLLNLAFFVEFKKHNFDIFHAKNDKSRKLYVGIRFVQFCNKS